MAQEKKLDGVAMFGSLPCLEDTEGNVKLNQSAAMLQYAATKGGASQRLMLVATNLALALTRPLDLALALSFLPTHKQACSQQTLPTKLA